MIQYYNPALPTQYPWFASIHRITEESTKFYVCGGTIINERSVLTAASCFFGFAEDSDLIANPSRFLVEVGRFSRNGLRNLDAYDVLIDNIKTHPNYKPYTNEKDNLAVVILSHQIYFNEFVQPVDFWTRRTPLGDLLGMVNYIFNIIL